jgi:NAD(P)H-dependent FMN reductase
MITVVSGTNRPGSNTLKVANLVRDTLGKYYDSNEVHLIDLKNLPPEIFSPECYASKPQNFAAEFQAVVDKSKHFVFIVPEYNGSFPGVLKYFIDMLSFPQSLAKKEMCFIGLAAGNWGALRAVEQLELTCQYLGAYLFPKRVFIPKINEILTLSDGKYSLNSAYTEMIAVTLKEFADFCRRNQ